MDSGALFWHEPELIIFQGVKVKYRILAVLGVLVFAAGCKSSESKSSSKEFYQYEVTENGCPSGKHSFNDKPALCAALKNDSLNNDCAARSRVVLYQQYGCESGTTVVESQAQRRSFTYNLSQNDCTTGAHTFVSKDELCTALYNDSLNNYCASIARAQMYVTNRCGRI